MLTDRDYQGLCMTRHDRDWSSARKRVSLNVKQGADPPLIESTIGLASGLYAAATRGCFFLTRPFTIAN